MQSVSAFSIFDRPHAALKMPLPEIAPLQFSESVLQPLDRLFPRLRSMRLRQNKMHRRNVMPKQKLSHYRQMFVYQFPRPPPRTIRAKPKLASKVRDYSGDVATAR
jgi:hypothetical protein